MSISIKYQAPRINRQFVDGKGGTHRIVYYIVVNGIRLGIVTSPTGTDLTYTARWKIGAYSLTNFSDLPYSASSLKLQNVRNSVRRQINKLVGDAYKLYLKGC